MGPKNVNAELQRDINDIKESLNSIIKELSDMKKIRLEDKENIDKLTNIISNLDSKLNDHLDNLLKSFKKGKTVFIC